MIASLAVFVFFTTWHTSHARFCNGAVFKWLSKVITWLRLLRLVIGLKDSRQFFNQWEAKPKPIAPCTRDISRASGGFQVIARNCDWFMQLFVPVVIGRSNCFGFGFSTVIWKPFYTTKKNATMPAYLCQLLKAQKNLNRPTQSKSIQS